jgi:hypothetical protein
MERPFLKMPSVLSDQVCEPDLLPGGAGSRVALNKKRAIVSRRAVFLSYSVDCRSETVLTGFVGSLTTYHNAGIRENGGPSGRHVTAAKLDVGG